MSTLNHKKCVRVGDTEQHIIDKVRDGFELSSDGEAIRFVLNFWWKSLGSGALDIEKLAGMLREANEAKE